MVMAKSQALQPKVVPAGEFKAKCLQLMDEVKTTGVPLIVTKRGKEVGRFVAPSAEEKVFAPLWGLIPSVQVHGDIISPLDWPEASDKWNRVVARKGKRTH